MDHLKKKFDLTNVEAMVAYDSFFKKYPKGELTKEQFLEEYKDNIMGEAFFRIFDEDGSGTLRHVFNDKVMQFLKRKIILQLLWIYDG